LAPKRKMRIPVAVRVDRAEDVEEEVRAGHCLVADPR